MDDVIAFEIEYPEEAKALMAICETRANLKLKGKRLKPIYLDAPEPIKANKTGRNDPCPCGSNKKYKKCCG